MSRGLYAYRHRKKYYIKYRHDRSYPSALGTELVNQIPADAEGFKEWLERKRAFFDEEEERLRDINLRSDAAKYYGKCSTTGYFQVPSEFPPKTTVWYEWTYTMDLDDKAFIVDMEISFPLDDIPRDEYGCHWMRCFDHDTYGDRCLLMTTPRDCVVIPSRPTPQPGTQGLVMYGQIESNLTLLPESEWLSQPLSLPQEFALDASVALVKLHYFWFYVSQTFETSSVDFLLLAFGLLSTTAEGLICTASKKYKFDSAIANNGHVDFSFCQWVEEKSKCPRNTSMWWLRGVLVHLTSHLDVEDNRKASVGSVVSTIQELELDFCVALLFSINHVIVVKVADGVVYASEVIELLAALPSLDWKQRLIAGLTPLVHAFRLPQFTDIASLESDSNDRPFPTDALLQILEYADNETYDQFSKLSKTWRGICKRHLRVGRYTVIGRDNGAFMARTEHGPITRIKLFWTCERNLRYSDDNYEVFLVPQQITQPEVGSVGSDFVRMRVRPPRSLYSPSSSDIRLVITEEGTELEEKMTDRDWRDDLLPFHSPFCVPSSTLHHYG
ncbi:hypothetical protein BD410DRAFT_795565 [Rickenella mellea]|uniref:F-box domain-containing protein n=1 Tax=Rickenella mellea TaxID=50990 RepID=A0A4Y7PM76_9AGAM|nr:hypothetical protein BD410DRAFT_795565 [Rickenella mellea]